MKKWEKLPADMKIDAVGPYYEALEKKKIDLVLKRIFDIIVSGALLILISPLFLILAIIIKLDSTGPVFFRQLRVTAYGKKFRIFKFRTMISDAERSGVLVTAKDDRRITKVGRLIRRYRLDEVPQLLDVFRGTMTFVGVRPEAMKYVEQYSPEMKATLLLPAGVTNLASIYFKDEDQLLIGESDTERIYLENILPSKMYWNLKGIKEFNFFNDIKILFITVLAVLGKDYRAKMTTASKPEKLGPLNQ